MSIKKQTFLYLSLNVVTLLHSDLGKNYVFAQSDPNLTLDLTSLEEVPEEVRPNPPNLPTKIETSIETPASTISLEEKTETTPET